MQVFARAATAGGLSAAARQLGLSSAMATKHLDALEAQLGVKLFHRTTRRLTLTEAGRGYLEACRRILADLDEADAAAASHRVEASGVLRMNVPLSFGVKCLAPLLVEFSRQHPRVIVELGLNDRAIDLLEEWDLTIRIGRLTTSRLIARKIANVDVVVCGAPAYLAERGVPKKVEELSGHNCLGYSMTELASPRTWVFGHDNSIHIPIQGNLYANNGDALVAAAIARQGLVYVPRFIARAALKSGALVAIELDQPYCNLGDIFAVYPPERHPPAKVRVMIDYLVSALATSESPADLG